MNSENSKSNEPHKCVLNLSQRLDLSLELVYLLHTKKCKTTVQKQ